MSYIMRPTLTMNYIERWWVVADKNAADTNNFTARKLRLDTNEVTDCNWLLLYIVNDDLIHRANQSRHDDGVCSTDALRNPVSRHGPRQRRQRKQAFKADSMIWIKNAGGNPPISRKGNMWRTLLYAQLERFILGSSGCSAFCWVPERRKAYFVIGERICAPAAKIPALSPPRKRREPEHQDTFNQNPK